MIHNLIFSGAALIYRTIVSLGPLFLIWFAFICLLTAILPDKTTKSGEARKRKGWEPRLIALAIAIVAVGLVILIEPESTKLRANDQKREARAYSEAGMYEAGMYEAGMYEAGQ